MQVKEDNVLAQDELGLKIVNVLQSRKEAKLAQLVISSSGKLILKPNWVINFCAAFNVTFFTLKLSC